MNTGQKQLIRRSPDTYPHSAGEYGLETANPKGSSDTCWESNTSCFVEGECLIRHFVFWLVYNFSQQHLSSVTSYECLSPKA